MTGSCEVLLEVDGGVAVVTLNAPDRRNALTPAMASELIATFDEVDARSDVGALVIKAVGKSFCAGGDIATLTSAGQDPAAPEAYEGMGLIYDSFYRLGQVRVPTVAAVRGSAVGAGMNMLLAADLRIVANDARLLCGFLKRGMHPGGGHFVILSRLIGREAAAAMALFGEEINGARAVELGLAWESLDDAAVEDRALELATRVAADPELARAAVGNFRKEVINSAVGWDVAMQYERPAQMWSMRRVHLAADLPRAALALRHAAASCCEANGCAAKLSHQELSRSGAPTPSPRARAVGNGAVKPLWTTT